MATILDNPRKLESLDKGNMLRTLSLFPQNSRKAIEAAGTLPLGNISDKDFDEVVFVGMGGSAIGGDLLKDWLMDDCEIPIHVSRGYNLPKFVDGDSLIIAVSYSGNTEETLRALGEALNRRCSVITVTSGGDMAKLASKKEIPCLLLPTGLRPRASLPDQFFSLATLADRLALTSNLWGEVDEALNTIESLRSELSPEAQTSLNPSKKLAIELNGSVPFVYGSELLRSVAYRMMTQLNENSKVPAGSGFFPEAFHNLVMSREGRREILKHISILLVLDPLDRLEVDRKLRNFERIMEPKFGKLLEITAKGKGRLARIMSSLYIGDYTSTYLAFLYGLDPSSTDSIELLKKR